MQKGQIDILSAWHNAQPLINIREHGDRWVDEWIDGWMEKRMDSWMDVWVQDCWLWTPKHWTRGMETQIPRMM